MCEGGVCVLLYIFITIKRSGSLILPKYGTNSSPLSACNSGNEFYYNLYKCVFLSQDRSKGSLCFPVVIGPPFTGIL